MRKRDRGKMIRDLKAYFDAHQTVPSNLEWDKHRKPDQATSRTYRMAFGGWLAALTAAGIKADRRQFLERWNRAKIVSSLKTFAEKQHRIPTSRDLGEEYPSVQTIKHYFGSLRKGLEEANLVARARRYSDAEIANHLRNLYGELGRLPTQREINSGSGKTRPSTSVLRKRYGNISNAFVAAKLPGARLAQMRHWFGTKVMRLAIRIMSTKEEL